MSLAQISELPKTPEDLAMWSFAHASFHHDVDQAVQRIHGVTLPEFALDPFDPRDTAWLYHHAVNHNARNAVLGIQGYDLTNADWSTEETMLDWINLHAAEEQYAAQVLNLS